MTPTETQAISSERDLSLLWKKAHTLSSGLVTENGQTFRILYPGRPNPRAGPDYLDAVLLTESGQRVRGDVELHLNASDWHSHHHDTDGNYNGVVLHIVLRPKGRLTSPQKSGNSVPVASIAAVADELDANTPLPEIAGRIPQSDVGEMLDRAGNERFMAKSRGFAIEMAEADSEQVLYRSIMEALGYASNRRPFRELADRVPIELLIGLRNEPPATRLLAIRAVLFGASGLISHLPSDEARLLKKLRKYLPKTHTMRLDSWHTFRVRPTNHPVKRIEGAAHLIDGFMESGLLKGFEDYVRSQETRWLASHLTVRPFIGKGRASDIVVNVVLPFFNAYGGISRSSQLCDTCFESFRTFPKLQENEITKEMRRLLSIDNRSVKIDTARRQQGLIQMYKTLPNRVTGRMSPDPA
jgi:hypothetical protein